MNNHTNHPPGEWGHFCYITYACLEAVISGVARSDAWEVDKWRPFSVHERYSLQFSHCLIKPVTFITIQTRLDTKDLTQEAEIRDKDGDFSTKNNKSQRSIMCTSARLSDKTKYSQYFHIFITDLHV